MQSKADIPSRSASSLGVNHLERKGIWFMRPWVVAGIFLWCIAIAGGMKLLNEYANSAGPETSPPAQWPEASSLARAFDRPTLIMFVHPHCPCSRASLEELNRFLVVGQNRLSVQVVFFQPAAYSQNWSQTDLWRKAKSLPGVRVLTDDGAEAKRFNVDTSGTALFYNDQGHLEFHGGITLSRGHSGDNPGRAILERLLTGGNAPAPVTPVFGCPLLRKVGETPLRSTLCR